MSEYKIIKIDECPNDHYSIQESGLPECPSCNNTDEVRTEVDLIDVLKLIVYRDGNLLPGDAIILD